MSRKNKERFGAFAKILVGLVFAIPVIMCVMFSIQPNTEINTIPNHLIAKNPTLENYVYVLKNIPIFTYLKNTLIMILIEVPIQIIIASVSAFVFAFFEFPCKNLIFTIYITTMMVPGETTLIAKYMMIRDMGLMNSYLGLTIVSLVGAGSIFMLRQNMMSLPRELWEASEIDGCTEMKYFWKVVLPLCKPLIASQAITSFIATFNSYIWPMMVSTKSDFYTLQVGMAQLIAEASYGYGYVLAGAVLCMIIPLTIYIVAQRHIVAGMTAGAIKS